MTATAKKWVSIWLAIGLMLVFVQVILGGITRLTDSGLSITEWKLVKGVIPPTNEETWNLAFDKYQTHAKKQYESIHSEMTLPEFKKIYFWEWFHRFWGRFMSLVFIFPFVFFIKKKWLPIWLIKRLIVVIILAAVAGAFGWIMVASGLNEDNRTWVSAYKLAAHLLVATALFTYLFYTFFKVVFQGKRKYYEIKLQKITRALILICLLQIMLGGFMAGMRAGAIHPHWPIFAGGNHLLEIVANPDLIQESEIINYEGSVWIKALVQVFHRGTALLLTILVVCLLLQLKHKAKVIKNSAYLILFFLIIQYTLGVLTVIGIAGSKVPLNLGVLHQCVALLFLASIFYMSFLLSGDKKY